ncbi:MAG TPA: hypothetical protein PLX56_04500 [bacterium]|nr:hypothetical protein [bacterium]HQN73019.1 hypothetical protein [bacterium]HQO91572.1 hypothetical protein [bacterium]
MFSTEMRITKELGNYHYGWFCLFSFDFGHPDGSNIRTPRLQEEQFENIFISSEEMDEIRDQINYMLEEEEEENETVIDPAEENEIHGSGDPDDP